MTYNFSVNEYSPKKENCIIINFKINTVYKIYVSIFKTIKFIVTLQSTINSSKSHYMFVLKVIFYPLSYLRGLDTSASFVEKVRLFRK